SGRPVTTPTQDMVIGCYYLTSEREGAKGEGSVFGSVEEVGLAYHSGAVSLHAQVEVRRNGERIKTTPGRIFFNEALPDEMGYFNEVIDRKSLGRLIDNLFRRFGSTRTAQVLDALKRLGFTFATRS